MLRSRSLIGMLLISGFCASACGPQPEPTDTTTTAPAELADQCNQPGVTYVSRDTTECLAITWTCPSGKEQFLNDCGCGCK